MARQIVGVMSENQDWRPVIEALKAVSAADGTVSQEEQAWLSRIFEELDLPEEVEARLDLGRLREVLSQQQDREDLLKLMLVLSLADGTTTRVEWSMIQTVAQALGVSDERLESLRSTTVLAQDPT